MSSDRVHPIFAPLLNALSGGSKLKIITEHVYPPIPIRSWDWSAHLDDYDPDPECRGFHPVGWGATKAEAIQDLKDQLEAEEDPRLAHLGCAS